MHPLTLLTEDAIQSLVHYARLTTGTMAEIGVYKGGSAWHLAQLRRPLYLYDTFEGMPFHGPLDGNKTGAFNDTSLEEVKRSVFGSHVHFLKGIFPETLVPMGPLGFVHADGDQYETTKAICTLMPDRMLPGGMLLFDDFEVPGCEGCTQAVKEHFTHIARTQHGKALIII